MFYKLRGIGKRKWVCFLEELGVLHSGSQGYYQYLGNVDVELCGDDYVKPLDKAEKGSLSFYYCKSDESDMMIRDKIFASKASVVIVSERIYSVVKLFIEKTYSSQMLMDKLIVFVPGDVRLFVVKLLHKLVDQIIPEVGRLPLDCYVGSGVTVEEGVEIGKGVILEGNIYIHSGTKIGDNVRIKVGTIIGGMGFGYVKDEQGKNWEFPHLGGVVIGDRVRIGSNVCIDRGVLEDTVLEEGCCIDNLVHIAHGVRVGRNSLVAAGVITGGGVDIGERAFVGLSATIIPQKRIGEFSVVGASSCVTKDVPENLVVCGVPAKVIKLLEGRK